MTDIPLSRPTLGEEEEQAVLDVMRSGWITSGPKCEDFERRFQEQVRSDNAVAVSSGTAALHLALKSIGVSSDDRVVTPSITWPSVPNLIKQLGADPVFVDVNPRTLNIDPEDLEQAIDEGVKAVVPVHFAGRAYDFDGIQRVLDGREITVIDDAAHALGTTYQDVPIGGLTPISCFSFHAIKNVTTGEGGMVTCERSSVAERIRLLSYLGVSRDSFDRYESGDLPHYRVEEPGFKYNLTDIQAAIGIEQIKKLPEFNRVRRQLASRYHDLLDHLPLELPPLEERAGCTHSWHLFVVKVSPESDRSREELMRHLQQEGIGTGLHFLPVHQMPPFDSNRDLPATEDVGSRLFSLPLYPGLSDTDQKRVASALQDCFAY